MESHVERGVLYKTELQYIETLNNIQEELGFTSANKLKLRHIMSTKHKINVRITTQIPNSSVAKSINFLFDDINIPNFEGSEATTYFIKKTDLAFDMIESWNPHAQRSKSAVTL